MTVKDIYNKLSALVPESEREEWDNDGLMCASDTSREVLRALVTLDVTESVVDYAISNGFDLILSHHPLIFRPLRSVTEDSHVARKVISLIENDIAVISLHTRLDKVAGGVNDTLAELLGIKNAVPFGDGGLGRIGELPLPMPLEDFACLVRGHLGADGVKLADAYLPVSRVAVVGGDGKDFVLDAIAAGADTYLSGRIGYNIMTEAGEMGINMIEAGHFFTEHPITSVLSSMLTEIDPKLYVEVLNSNVIRYI